MADQLHKVRSWYGLSGEIVVENQLLHFVKIGGFPLPHPPLVNWFLRAGLAEDERLRLGFLHEFGHLQTFPVVLIYTAWLLINWRRNRRYARLNRLVLGVLGHQALWELSSESYALLRSGSEYKEIYQKYPYHLDRIIFWVGMTALVILSNLLFFRWDTKKSESVIAR